MSGKAKMARISGQALGSLYFGLSPSLGVVQTQFGETTAVPASSPYTYSTNNHATFVADQGVVYALRAALKQVASVPCRVNTRCRAASTPSPRLTPARAC